MNRSRLSATILIALVMVGFSLCRYYSNSQINPITGETQHISINTEQEIALGLQSAPAMAQQHGGLYPDEKLQTLVDNVGNKLLQSSEAKNTPYEFSFHLLADDQTVNAFALPGGPVFITYALLARLKNEDQLAGVLGHEIGHVVARHSAARIAKQELTQGITGAVVMATYDPNNPNSQQTAQMAQMIGNVVNMKYGREDELQSDELGVKFMIEAGYNPEEMIGVMEILKEASGGREQSEFFSTHPNPENRMEKIREAIQKYSNLKKS